ncbi:DUF2829 domain-containing protein [Xenorhabdus sp. KJ12.1]|uniref:DUF2829 domain-containing protein n=1 Tax=Xenorhabdus sp. KJ12.1 TaxID=1851571 RepID=UPI000C050724|nr:DUF2829 domain-containing protein [Xenorhabdus sp. KJ12.1]PHM67346.1 hypothetical protein Xekj_03890 [Xenorhabdus sp. KJ12.1]
MSEFIKPEHECPFDPKQYHCDCFIAPVGSFSWALIQLKLRKRVTRSVWVNCQGNNEMYLAITPRVNNLAVEKDSAYAVDGVAVGTKYDYLTHIDLRNEHGNFVPWQPTQEDMMACDWNFVEQKEERIKPKPFVKPAHQLKVRLTVGEYISSNKTHYVGYGDLHGTTTDYSTGAWEVISNDTLLPNKIRQFRVIHSNSEANRDFVLDEMSNSSKIKDQLGSKKLIIKYLDKEYDLGIAKTYYSATLLYPRTEGSAALEELFISSIGKILELEFNFFEE